MNITNKTQKPLSVPLPGGRKLFLGPGKTGQVSPKALEYAPLKKLIESGDIETAEGGSQRIGPGGDASNLSHGSRHDGTGAIRSSGDR